MTDTNSKRHLVGLGLAALVLGAAILAAGIAGAAAVDGSPYDVELDDPDNETVEVTTTIDNVSSPIDVTTQLTDGDVIFDQETVSGDNETLTTSLNASSAPADEPLDIVVDSPTASNVTVDSTTVVRETSAINVTDADNETVAVDVAFAGDVNGSATITVSDADDGTELLTDTVDYVADQHDGSETFTREFNASDGITAGNVSATIATSPASVYDGAWLSFASEDTESTLLGGTIAGQDTTIALLGLALVGTLFVWARREGKL